MHYIQVPLARRLPCVQTNAGSTRLRPCSDLLPGCCSDAPVPGTKNVLKQLGKGINYREMGDKFGVSASSACEKVNTAGTDENLFRLVPVPGHWAWDYLWS